MKWRPTDIVRFEKSFPTHSCTARVQTDAGPAYVKAMGPHESPNVLACELVGTRLAEWLGLAILDYAVIAFDGVVDIELRNRSGAVIGKAQPGPAFVTRAEVGASWGGDSRQLNQLSNPHDISRLVVFDTWTLNCDRYRPAPEKDRPSRPRINRDNVFLSTEAPSGKLALKAIDQGCCFTCGRELTKRIGAIDNIKNTLVFGLFPEFHAFLDRDQVRDAVQRLRKIDPGTVRGMLAAIPSEWDVRSEAIEPWIELIVGRAMFVADTIEARLWRQSEFDY